MSQMTLLKAEIAGFLCLIRDSNMGMIAVTTLFSRLSAMDHLSSSLLKAALAVLFPASSAIKF